MVIFDYTYNENLSTDYDANLLWGRQGHWHHWLDIVLSYRTMMRKRAIRCFHDTLFRSLYSFKAYWTLRLTLFHELGTFMIMVEFFMNRGENITHLHWKLYVKRPIFQEYIISKVYNYTLFQTFLMNDKETDLLWWLW